MTERELADILERNLNQFGTGLSATRDDWGVVLAALRFRALFGDLMHSYFREELSDFNDMFGSSR